MPSFKKIAGLLVTLYFPFFLCGQEGAGPVAKYTFNDTKGRDEAGKNDAVLRNVLPTDDRFGNANYAYFMHGNSSSYINLGKTKTLKPKHGTVSLWAKLNLVCYNGSGVAANPIIITKAHDGVDFNEAYSIAYNFNLHHLTAATSLSELHQAYVHPDKTTSLREWHHVVMTYDNEFLSYYLDGVLEGKVTKGFESKFLDTDSVLVGICVDKKNQRFFCGCVDDIEIYNKVLSPEEVVKLYHSPNPNRFRIILYWVLASLGILLLIALGIWLVRRHFKRMLQRELEKNRLTVQWYEQENKVLRAQMNPHFIFNSLNTIQQFILLNDNETAQLYLSKFSTLMRKQMESSLTDKISLAEEIDLCENYLEIESLRFNKVFRFSITVDKRILPESVHIPHALIQPFIENAIWHGLLQKKGAKDLTISFEPVDEKTLSCAIEDNGIGRGTEKITPHKKSLAIKFIQQRLTLYSKTLDGDYSLTITDKTGEDGLSEGTLVLLRIPILKE